MTKPKKAADKTGAAPAPEPELQVPAQPFAPEAVDLADAAMVYNPGPDALVGDFGGRFYAIDVGERILPKGAADHFAGPPGCPGGTFGKRGLRQFGPTYTDEQKAAVRYDGARAAYLFCLEHGIPIIGAPADIAQAVIDGKVDATVRADVVVNPAAPVAGPLALRNPLDGETFDPRLHRPQNRPTSEKFAEKAGFHDAMKGAKPATK